VLRGAGPQQTHLNVNHAGHAVEFTRFERGAWVSARAGLRKGSSVVTLDDASRFVVGRWAEIDQENDPAVMYTDPEWDQPWSVNAVGQIVRVTAIAGNQVTIDPPLHIDFDLRLRPRVRPQRLLERAGIESLHLRRLDSSDTHMINMQNVSEVWVSRILSERAAKSHVEVNTGSRVEIRDSDFRDASNHGGGGHGYGINLSQRTTGALVENNVFRRLRHSMLVQVGVNGSVFGYNYSRETQSEAAWVPPDISVHGHYPFANLFEGNIVQGAAVTDYWGPAGPHNLFFRNRVEHAYGFRLADASHYQNVVGNEIAGGAITRDATVDAATLIVHGNRVHGTVSWDAAIADRELPESYYLDAQPPFFGDMAWPGTGADIADGINPAKSRYLAEAGPLTRPGAPGAPRIVAAGTGLSIGWTDPTRGSAPARYTVVARLRCDGPIVAELPVGNLTSAAVTGAEGAFCLSVRAANAAGDGPESPRVLVSVEGGHRR